MKIQSTIFLILFALVVACDEDATIQDPVYEFAAFKEAGPVNLNELNNSTEAYPVVIQLFAFQPYSEDLTFQYTATGNNTAEGTDFTVTPAGSITLKAGKLTSDTIWVKTIDNQAGTPDARSFNLAITSASKSDIKLGLGLADPKQKTLTFNILDDECSLTTDIYTATLDVLIGIDGETRGTNVAEGNLVGNELSITGDLIWYGRMDDALVITLEPESPGSTKGTATMGTQFMGTAGDGYEYTFEEVGTGSYDVCSGTVTISYKTSYRAVGETDWTPWQTVTNLYQLQ